MGRLSAHHPVSPVGPHHRIRIPEPVIGQVACGDEAAVGGEVGSHGFRQFPAIEIFGPVFGQVLEGRGVVGVGHPVADLVRSSAPVEIDPPRLGIALDVVHQAGGFRIGGPRPPSVGQILVHQEAFPGDSGRRLQDCLPGTGSPALQHGGESLDRTGDADRLVSQVVDLVLQEEAPAVGIGSQDRLLPHGGRDLRTGHCGGIQDSPVPLGIAGEVERRDDVAADPAHVGAQHRLHQGAGDGGVHRVAARHQDLGPLFHRHGLGSDDHSGHEQPFWPILTLFNSRVCRSCSVSGLHTGEPNEKRR